VNRLVVVCGLVVTALLTGCAELDQLKQQNADLQAQLAAMQAERDRTRDQSALLENQVKGLQGQVAEAQSTADELAALRQKLGSEVQVSVKGGLVTIELPEKVLYKSGEASLTERGKATLRKVGAALNSQFAGYPLRVEGHTDTDPIRRTRNLYKSNWELSSTRALEVVHFLAEQCGLDPKRVHAAAFGQYQPVVANTTAASKQQNRRVAIVVLPQLKK
jgi:chemotaxis protein MotB